MFLPLSSYLQRLIFTFQDFIERFAERNPITGAHEFSTTRLGLIVGMLSIGCLVGSFFAGPLGDHVGRRKAILILCGVFYLGNTLFITAMTKWYHIIIARIVSGLAIGGCSSKFPGIRG